MLSPHRHAPCHICLRVCSEMRCFKGAKGNGDVGLPPEMAMERSAQLERRSKAIELKGILIGNGIQPVVVGRESLVINMDCIAEQKNEQAQVQKGNWPSSGQHTSSSAVPALADGERTSSPSQPRSRFRLPRGFGHRGFVRVESTQCRSPHTRHGQQQQANQKSNQQVSQAASQHASQQAHQQASQPGKHQPNQHASQQVNQLASSPLQTEELVEGEEIEQPTPSGQSTRALNWTPSRRALAVLVVREEHLSRTDKGLDALTHNKRLDERLERLNLDMLTMAGDGNCQFRTLAHELYGSQDHHSRVRARVMQHIRDNREEFECFLGEDFDTYVASMSRACTWGDELTLRAACDAFGIVIFVVTSDTQNWFLTYEPKEFDDAQGGELFLAYIAPIHYNAIRRKPSLRILSKQLSSSFKRLANSGSLNPGTPSGPNSRISL